RNLAGGVAGPLVLATSHHIGLHRLPPVLRGEVELAVITLPPSVEPPLQALPLWLDPLVAVAARTHPLAQGPEPAAAALGEHPAILPGEATFTRLIIEEGLARLGVAPPVAFATNYLETIKMMVVVGLGWSVLPRTMLDGELVELAIAGLRLQRLLGVVCHTGRTLSNAARAMVATLGNTY
ncbi:MAG TPA: LysR family transcriptional regulator substrate-binding protein, partial [Candidatus Competibacteraceae bacterium]|nr:LysR family transcriptional regulator substrate-binding protein [Candidatus Competibacteraceae bacterium]